MKNNLPEDEGMFEVSDKVKEFLQSVYKKTSENAPKKKKPTTDATFEQCVFIMRERFRTVRGFDANSQSMWNCAHGLKRGRLVVFVEMDKSVTKFYGLPPEIGLAVFEEVQAKKLKQKEEDDGL